VKVLASLLIAPEGVDIDHREGRVLRGSDFDFDGLPAVVDQVVGIEEVLLSEHPGTSFQCQKWKSNSFSPTRTRSEA
jgi:hypothetical protein